jgi:methyltransferase (TIGR00027 family)
VDTDGPSRTALIVAAGRGAHRLNDEPPWVFDDPFALSIVGPEWPELLKMVELLPERVARGATGNLLARARYTEDRLTAGEFDQYVILGAGLDTFAWRRPDVLRRTRVFEVDHPNSQAWKRARAAELALPSSDSHRFVSVDFEQRTWADGLDAAGFDWSRRTLCSWLGVTMYLTPEAISESLLSFGRCAAGSEIVLTYALDESLWDEESREFNTVFGALAAASGEPLITWFTPEAAEALVAKCGLVVVDHPTSIELGARYFSNRADRMHPLVAERTLVAGVR